MLHAGTSETEQAMGYTDEAVSMNNLLKLLVEERKLSAEEEQQRFEREKAAR